MGSILLKVVTFRCPFMTDLEGDYYGVRFGAMLGVVGVDAALFVGDDMSICYMGGDFLNLGTEVNIGGVQVRVSKFDLR